MKLHDLQPADGSRTAADARRSRHRRRQGQDRRPRHEGPEGARRRLDPALVRGRPDPAPHADPEAARLQEPRSRSSTRSSTSAGSPSSPSSARSRPATLAGRQGAKAKPAPITVNQEILRAVGLVRTLDKPMKVLGQGDVEVALFVVADAFSKSAVAKIEAAGGSVQVLEIPTGPLGRPAALERRPEPADARRGRHAAPSVGRRRPARQGRPRPPPRPRAEAASRRAGRRGRGREPAATGKAATAPSRGRRGRRRPPTPRRGRRAPRPPRSSRRHARSDADAGRRRRLTVLENLLNAFRAPDIRRRLLFVAGILIVFRFLAHVPVPGADPAALSHVLQQQLAAAGCSTCSRAAGCRGSRSSGSG